MHKTILKTLKDNNNISLFIPKEFITENNKNYLLINNKENKKKVNAYRLRYPQNLSGKKLNILVNKEVTKDYSLFNQLKKILIKNKNKTYSLIYKDNNMLLRFYNLTDSIIKEFKIKVVV